MKKITIPFFISHQGCPHTCSFCDQKTISGGDRALPNSSEILQKISDWRIYSNDRPLEVAFFGGTFTALPIEVQEQLLQPLQKPRQAGIVSCIRISTRPDYISPEIVTRLKQWGVTTIEIGVQSMDNQVLQSAARGHLAVDSLNAITVIKEQGLVIGAQLMPGLLGDTLLKCRKSLQQVVQVGVDFLRIYPVVVLEKTELALQYQNGIYKPLSLKEGVEWCKVLLHDAMISKTPVIRIGLQADEGLNKKTILAGCWHPALGQLVRSALYADLIEKMLLQTGGNSIFSLQCHSSRISDCIGQNREHLHRFKSRISDVAENNSLLKDEIVIKNIKQSFKYSILTDLNYMQGE